MPSARQRAEELAKAAKEFYDEGRHRHLPQQAESYQKWGSEFALHGSPAALRARNPDGPAEGGGRRSAAVLSHLFAVYEASHFTDRSPLVVRVSLCLRFFATTSSGTRASTADGAHVWRSVWKPTAGVNAGVVTGLAHRPELLRLFHGDPSAWLNISLSAAR
jgi:hypothetical protein